MYQLISPCLLCSWVLWARCRDKKTFHSFWHCFCDECLVRDVFSSSFCFEGALLQNCSCRYCWVSMPMKMMRWKYVSGVHSFSMGSLVEETCCFIASSNCIQVSFQFTVNSQSRNFELVPFEVVVPPYGQLSCRPGSKLVCCVAHRARSQKQHRAGEFVHSCLMGV